MHKQRSLRRQGARQGDRFRVIAAYVHSTHFILALGTVLAPVLSFAVELRSPVAMFVAIFGALIVAVGASSLVSAEFAPDHRIVRWMHGLRKKSWVGAATLASALIVAALVPVTGHPVTAAAVALAWALRAVSGGPFWSGIVRLLIATTVGALAMLIVEAAWDIPWEPLTLVVAALLALGVLGQDSIYALAIELDDLRTRESERAIMTERKRFAGDLHDIQGQHLGLIVIEAELVNRLIQRSDYTGASEHAERIQAITLEALDEMHRVVHANREVRLDDEIVNALRVLQAAGVAARRDGGAITGVNGEADRLLGLTVREAITNILKHTRATTCSVTTQQEFRSGRAGVALTVADSGPTSSKSLHAPRFKAHERTGTGLKTLSERYRELDGELEFTTQNGGRLTGWLPLSNTGVNGNT